MSWFEPQRKTALRLLTVSFGRIDSLFFYSWEKIALYVVFDILTFTLHTYEWMLLAIPDSGYAPLSNLSFSGTCKLKNYGHASHVCVCSTRHCGALYRHEFSLYSSDSDGFTLYTTSQEGLRFHKTEGLFVQTKLDEGKSLTNLKNCCREQK